MPRPAAPFTRSGSRASGSAAIARARLDSALSRDRAAHNPAPARDARHAQPSAPDLLDLLLSQAPSGRGRP